jgi:hypothetical protein
VTISATSARTVPARPIATGTDAFRSALRQQLDALRRRHQAAAVEAATGMATMTATTIIKRALVARKRTPPRAPAKIAPATV